MKVNILLAIAEAERKQVLGLLVWDEIPDQEEHTEKEMNDFWVTPQGDRETIYSIASLYSSENMMEVINDKIRKVAEKYDLDVFELINENIENDKLK